MQAKRQPDSLLAQVYSVFFVALCLFYFSFLSVSLVMEGPSTNIIIQTGFPNTAALRVMLKPH